MIRPNNPLSVRWHYHRRKPKPGPGPETGLKDTLGSGACWCGKAYKHDWEGKADGAPHPR